MMLTLSGQKAMLILLIHDSFLFGQNEILVKYEMVKFNKLRIWGFAFQYYY